MPTRRNVITDEAKPTILGPTFDDHINKTAAQYVVHHDDRAALREIVESITASVPNHVLPDDEAELWEQVEWWVRDQYRALPNPNPRP